ncbi:MAG: FG-GAP-like repeat-containing protein, partial [Dehalococcoidia bacterium]
MKYWDDDNAEGAWSAGSDAFTMANQPSTAAEYGAKIENGGFFKYVFDNNTWTATDKKGTVYTFGPDTASRQDSGTKINKWMLQKIEDSNGNYVRYEYFKDAGQIYPSKIYYTGNGANAGIFEIEFLRQSRADKPTMYHTGFAVTTNYRISEIQAKVSGIWRRKYALGYSMGDNGVRSLLSSITESGQDESASVITLPATAFSYSSATKNWGPMDTSYAIPVAFVVDGKDNAVRQFEINGDGYVDMGGSGGNPPVSYLNKTDGTGWQQGSYSNLPELFTTTHNDIQGYDTGARAVDVNGDYLTDIVRGDAPAVNKVYLNNRTQMTWIEQAFTLPENFVNQGLIFADVNGDGLLDLVRSDGLQGTDTKKIYVNQGDGTGWREVQNYAVPFDFLNSDASQDTGVRPADVNGDGLTDFVQSQKSGTSVYQQVWLNRGDGTGWVLDPAFLFPANIYFRVDALPQGTAFVDVNGDGLADILHSQVYDSVETKKVFINKGNGTGWFEDTAYGIPDRLRQGNFASTRDTGVRLADINADGLVDFMRYDYRTNNPPEPPTIYKWTFTHLGNVPDLLTGVTKSTGASTTVAYQASTQYKNGSALLNPQLPFSIQTVKQITTDDGRGTLSNTAYSYEGGYYYFNTPYDRKYAGFQKVTETDHSGNVTKTFYHQGNTTDSANGEYSDHISKRGKPYRVEQYNNAGNVFSKTISKWERVILGGGRYFVKKTQELNFSYDGDADHRDTASTFTYDDTSGNLTQKKSWGEVAGLDSGTFTDTGTDIFITDLQYASNQTAYIIGLPKQETTTDQSAQKVSESRHYWDLQALGTVTKGNETKREIWV